MVNVNISLTNFGMKKPYTIMGNYVKAIRETNKGEE